MYDIHVFITFRDRPFNLQGGGRLWFFLFAQIFFFEHENFLTEFNIRLYNNNSRSESDYYFFPPPKSEYFFQQYWESKYFFWKNNITPLKLNGRSLSRSRKSKKDRQYNGQKTKYKRTNNDLQNITEKTKHQTTRTPLKGGGELEFSWWVSSSCSTCGTRRAAFVTNPVISHE